MTVCAVCGKGVPVVAHHFPHRKPPDNQPFEAALYFRDPFFGQTFEEYCGPVCSGIGHHGKQMDAAA